MIRFLCLLMLNASQPCFRPDADKGADDDSATLVLKLPSGTLSAHRFFFAADYLRLYAASAAAGNVPCKNDGESRESCLPPLISILGSVRHGETLELWSDGAR